MRYENLIGATFAPNRITGWFSNYGYHDSAISLALVNDAIMRALSPGSSLKFINHPLPYSIENLVSYNIPIAFEYVNNPHILYRIDLFLGKSYGFRKQYGISICVQYRLLYGLCYIIPCTICNKGKIS